MELVIVAAVVAVVWWKWDVIGPKVKGAWGWAKSKVKGDEAAK